MTLTSILRRMGHTDITVHGFRSSFRDWAGDTTHFPKEIIGNALAHQLKDKAEAAYARSTQLSKRRDLMELGRCIARRLRAAPNRKTPSTLKLPV